MPLGVGSTFGAGTLNGSSSAGAGVVTGAGFVSGKTSGSIVIGCSIFVSLLKLYVCYPELNETVVRVPDKKVSLILKLI